MGKRARTRKGGQRPPEPPRKAAWWRSPLLWLGSTITAVLLVVASAIVNRYYEPDLRVALEVPFVLSIPAREIRGGVERQLLSAVVCVENRSFQSGALRRAVVAPIGLARVPDLEIVRIDQDPIAWRSARPIEVVIALKSPFTFEETTSIGFRLDLYDANDKYVDDINIVGTFNASSPKSVSNSPNTIERTVPAGMCDPVNPLL